MSKTPVLILGARSDIGLAVARRFAAAGHPIQLAARRSERLEGARTDIALRYNVTVTLHELDVLDTAAHRPFLDALLPFPGVTVCAVGLMGEQRASEHDADQAALVMRSNFEAPALILGEIANRYEAAGAGVIVGIGSVAGERGRATNYVYGAAKAGFAAFLSGLRNRLAKKGVHVLTVLPGFVATRMTEGMDLPARLTARPEELGEAIFAAVGAQRDIIHVRRIWGVIMTVIRAIPERIFKRMSL